MIHQIYILVIIIVTAVIIMYYYIQEVNHQKEIDKINRIESINKRENGRLDEIRAKTTPCQVGDFDNPRSCYFESGYACSWNDQAKRCDSKK